MKNEKPAMIVRGQMRRAQEAEPCGLEACVPRAPSDTNTSLLGILLWTNPFESLSEL
jgi:hypothetical protein